MRDRCELYLMQKKADQNNDEPQKTMKKMEAEFGLSNWLGAIFYYLVYFGHKPFEELSTKKYLDRNNLSALIIRMVFIVGVIWLAVRFLKF